MLIIHLVTVLIFVALGMVFMKRKGAFLIAGYNTATKEEKEKYDEKALCKFMGKSMFALAACWLVAAFSEVIGSMVPYFIGMGLFIAVIVFMVIYANMGNRFRK